MWSSKKGTKKGTRLEVQPSYPLIWIAFVDSNPKVLADAPLLSALLRHYKAISSASKSGKVSQIPPSFQRVAENLEAKFGGVNWGKDSSPRDWARLILEVGEHRRVMRELESRTFADFREWLNAELDTQLGPEGRELPPLWSLLESAWDKTAADTLPEVFGRLVSDALLGRFSYGTGVRQRWGHLRFTTAGIEVTCGARAWATFLLASEWVSGKLPRPCEVCGGDIPEGSNRGKKTCSPACKQKRKRLLQKSPITTESDRGQDLV